MAMRGRKSLGIAFGNRSLQVAEINTSASGSQLVKSAEFLFGEGDSLSDPLKLGKTLAAFLKQNGFSARQAVAGVPAQWLMLKEKLLPPAAPAAVANMLRIQAERDFSMEPGALALDYIGGRAGGASARANEGTPAVLIAVLSERVERIRLLAKSAGLQLQIITATALVLGAAAQRPQILYIGANGVELAMQGSNGVPLLRYICPASTIQNCNGKPAMLALAGEVRRAMHLQKSGLQSSAITLVDDLGIAPEMCKELALALAEQTGEPPEGESWLKAFGVAGMSADPALSLSNGPALSLSNGAHAAGCAALALCAVRPDLAGVDFIHSRLKVKPPSKFNSKAIWGTVAALIFLGAALWLFLDEEQSAAEVAELQQKRDEMKDSVEIAKSFISRMGTTRTWYDRRPDYLECMRTITLCFPADKRVWTSGLSMHDDMHGVLSGHAMDEKSILEVLDKLKSSKAVTEIKLLNMHGSGIKKTDISFAIGFVYVGAG